MEFLWSSIFRTECFIETAASSTVAEPSFPSLSGHVRVRRFAPVFASVRVSSFFHLTFLYHLPKTTLDRPLSPRSSLSRLASYSIYRLPFFANPLKAIHTLFSLRLSPRPSLFHYPGEVRRMACVPSLMQPGTQTRSTTC